ncbi:hypothetical protein DFJ58DRAFT_843689 [Suillus subalutaceus]|uniref:uncharacterized protein n=1 Tax=Suillus subalutaceus TaxID=48586 RepID=UPI001B885D12|nr:uncharacterized protein DFJ58DRAFT_843689 [Suillus subalutaceus]KAG1845704.1 hypothetical protein DFJ58DRAFT_843689 [Suillus subalutaceus]
MSLFTIIRTQGIILYVIVFFASIVPFVVSWLNLNYVMNVFFTSPASSYAVIPAFTAPQSTSHRTLVRGPPEGTPTREDKPNFFDLVEEMMVLDSLGWSTYYCVASLVRIATLSE